MTKITLEKDPDFGYKRISVSGHSGYADEGGDIVCAYVSSAMELLMTILLDALEAVAETKTVPGKAEAELVLADCDKNRKIAKEIRAVTAGFAKQMRSFSEQYPEYVSMTVA